MTKDDDYKLAEDELLPLHLIPKTSALRGKGAKPAQKQRRPYVTQRHVDRAQPEEEEYTLYHRTIPGFGMRVRPTGYKSFILICKKQGKSGSTRITIGTPSTMSLQEAEDRAFKAHQNIRDYGDPDGEIYQGKGWTLNDMFKGYIEDHGRKSLSEKWCKQSEQTYHKYVEPEFGHKLLKDITRGELIRCIRSINSLYIQHHVQAILSSVYSWAQNLEYVADNIIKDAKLAKVKSRDRVLTNIELSAVYNASLSLPFPCGEYGRFLMLSGQRRSEVANMTWGEIDIEQKLWTLPTDRSKNGQQHTIPLTSAMLEILNSMPRKSKYVFESPINAGRPINGFTKMINNWRNNTWVKDWRPHDLRRSLASGMAELGIAPHVIEAVLNHRSGIVSGIAAVYNRYRYDKEKRNALDMWQEHLLAMAEKHKDFKPQEDDDCVEL